MVSGNLIPTYGRDYNSAQAFIDDFNKGFDFKINNHRMSTYCSIRDFSVGDSFQIRYNQLRDTAIIQLNSKGKAVKEVNSERPS